MAPLASAATRGRGRIVLPGCGSAALTLAGPRSRPAEALPVAGCRAIALRGIGAHVSAVRGVRRIRPVERLLSRCGKLLSSRTAVTRGQPSIGVCHSQPVPRIMRPDPTAAKPPVAIIATEAVAVEKGVVLKNRAVEPVRPPAPTAPSQAAEEASDVNPRAVSITITVVIRVVQRRIIAVIGLPPDGLGVILRHVDDLRIRRLNVNGSLVPLRLGGDSLLGVRLQFARRL